MIGSLPSRCGSTITVCPKRSLVSACALGVIRATPLPRAAVATRNGKRGRRRTGILRCWYGVVGTPSTPYDALLPLRSDRDHGGAAPSRPHGPHRPRAGRVDPWCAPG